MVCPHCGSRDVLDSRNSEKKLISAECQRCQRTWNESYDPEWKPPEIRRNNAISP